MSYSFWRPQPWRPGALAPLPTLATPLRTPLGLRNNDPEATHKIVIVIVT